MFITWYCSVGDCTFCYMSTQKDKIKDPLMAKRKKESILAEILLCKILDWKIEFISAGYGSYQVPNLVELIRDISATYGEKVWLNIGALKEPLLKQLLPYIKGVSGSIETLAPGIRDKICPSKPLKWFEDMFDLCDKYNVKKAITIIIGVGETEDDYEHLSSFIKKHHIDQVTFYRLKPVKGTEFEHTEPMSSDYYAGWISKTKQEFPHLKIIAGSWAEHFDEYTQLIEAGAEAMTKFPAIKKFNSPQAKQIIEAVEKADAEFKSNFTEYPKINAEEEVNKLPFDDNLKKRILEKLNVYLKSIQ